MTTDASLECFREASRTRTRRPCIVAGKPLDMDVAPTGVAVVAADDICDNVPAVHSYETERFTDDLEPGTIDGEAAAGCITAVAWSPDEGHPLVVGGNDDNQLIAWNPETGEVLEALSLGDQSSEVRSIAISGDGSTLVATSGSSVNGTIHVFDTETWEHRNMWESANVDTVDVDRNGRYVVTAGNDDHVVQLWDIDTKQRLGDPLRQARGFGSLGQVAFSPDEDASRVAVGTSQGLVLVWDRGTRRLLSVQAMHADFAHQVAFNPTDIDQMLSVGDDGNLMAFTCELCVVPREDLGDLAEERLAQVVRVAAPTPAGGNESSSPSSSHH